MQIRKRHPFFHVDAATRGGGDSVASRVRARFQSPLTLLCSEQPAWLPMMALPLPTSVASPAPFSLLGDVSAGRGWRGGPHCCLLDSAFSRPKSNTLMWVWFEVWETFRAFVVGALFQGQRTQSLKLRQFWGIQQLVSLPTIPLGNLTANGLGFAHLDALW